MHTQCLRQAQTDHVRSHIELVEICAMDSKYLKQFLKELSIIFQLLIELFFPILFAIATKYFLPCFNIFGSNNAYIIVFVQRNNSIVFKP